MTDEQLEERRARLQKEADEWVEKRRALVYAQLVALMKRHGLSRQKLSNLNGVSHTTYFRILSGEQKTIPDERTLMLTAAAVDEHLEEAFIRPNETVFIAKRRAKKVVVRYFGEALSARQCEAIRAIIEGKGKRGDMVPIDKETDVNPYVLDQYLKFRDMVLREQTQRSGGAPSDDDQEDPDK